MTISFQCSACKSIRSAPAAMAARRVRCPDCDALVEVIPLPEEKTEVESTKVEKAELEKAEIDGDQTIELQPIELDETLEVVDPFPSAVTAPHPQMAGPPRTPPLKTAEEEEESPKVKKSQLVETEMDMTPMVDATFQLLIFFMITAAFALQKSKEIPKPKSDEASTNVVQQDEDATRAVVVRIDEFNSYTVINADGDEEEAPSVVDLHTKLRRAHEGDSEGRTPTKLRVEAHDEATHDRVVTAIDAGNATGFAEVELTSLGEEA